MMSKQKRRGAERLHHVSQAVGNTIALQIARPLSQ